MPIPPGMKNGFVCNSLPDGRIELCLVKDGKEHSIQIDNKFAAQVAAQALLVAKLSFDRAGKPAPNFIETKSEWINLQPSSIGLGPAREPTHESLMIQFGNAILAIELEKSKLRALGEALIALSSQGMKQ